MAALGEDVVSTAAALVHRAVGGGRLYWSQGDSVPVELPLALQLRRHWGPTDTVIAPQWSHPATGMALAELRFDRPPDPRGVTVVIVDLDPAHWRFRVYGRPDWRRDSVADLADEARLSIAINASYFAEDGPLGLVVSDGTVRNRQGSRRAAHFVVDKPLAPPRIVNQRNAQVAGIEQGFQGFPAIMSGGRTFAYMRTGGRGFSVRDVDRRSAGCTDGRGHVLFLATDTWTSGLSFTDLATILGALGCVDAMAFDGGASTSMRIDVGEVRRHVDGLDGVPVIVGAEMR
ncbi:MAG: phosphodiester glycosidase family protein [Myxococcales bacterium]|nr:phosphodiester glycosidase family protein [Myxococcales bacterium]